MRWRSLPILVLIACLMMSSCASSPPPVIVQQPPLPAVLLTPCPPPVAPDNAGADAVMIALAQMYNLYGQCAGRLVELINYSQEQ